MSTLNADQRALARLALSGIAGAYFSARVRGEGALAVGLLELFQSRYNRWFSAIDAVYSAAGAGGRPSIVPTEVRVNGALDAPTRIAIIATLDTWLFTITGDTDHSAEVAELRTLTTTSEILSWWTDFTASFIPLVSSNPAYQNFWMFDTMVIEEPGSADAKVGALAIAAERAVSGRVSSGPVEVPGSIVSGKRPKSEMSLGAYVAVGTFTAILVGTGVLVYKRRRR